MSSVHWDTGIVPAQLSFLAIYCPSLGPTEETFPDQVVFHYSRTAHEARVAAKKQARNDAAGGDAIREAENEKLRQVGLAQGMVDFARSFSGGAPVDSIETEKSRIVLQELEEGWWILASIDLTRLPSLTPSSSAPTKKGAAATEAAASVEYSSREVSPSALLLQQLQQGHHVFTLHHGPSLHDLFTRLSRDKFCRTLDRYWGRFARSWNVLLHGNPASDVFGGLKLACGGELGIGVGEEDWGSGEREVLEDLARRTEGMIDVVVSRFGDPAPSANSQVTMPEMEAVPWLGGGREPGAADGVIFGGVGTLTRSSLRNLSFWMRQVYAYGEYSYGVKDNPLRERPKRRRRNPPDAAKHTNGKIDSIRSVSRDSRPAGLRQEITQKELAKQADRDGKGADDYFRDSRPELHPRVASQDHATTPEQTATPSSDSRRPNIPPPIVSAVEQALDKATESADETSEREQDMTAESEQESGTTLGIPDQYMKYLTFGLSTLGKPTTKMRPLASRQVSTATTIASPVSKEKASKVKTARITDIADDDEDAALLTHLEPMPDGETFKSKIALQKRQENKGYFVIGLKGDLDTAANEQDEGDMTESSLTNDTEGSRIVLRTMQVEITPSAAEEQGESPALRRRPSGTNVNTSDGRPRYFQRMRLVLYVHRPFMYCFLFENHTSSLSYMSFYQTLHRNLSAIYKPLLQSTSATKVAKRIEEAQVAAATDDDRASITSTGKSRSSTNPIFDLIYDPQLLTIHTSLPNIPDPGTLAAEGIPSAAGSNRQADPSSSWTRIEALTVHSQILSTLTSVAGRRTEVERTSKTSRGWWIVWMKVPPSGTNPLAGASKRDEKKKNSLAPPSSTSLAPPDATVSTEMLSGQTSRNVPPVSTFESADHRVAFLVRKAVDTPSGSSSRAASAAVASPSSRAMSSMLSHMTLGFAGGDGGAAESREDEITGGAGAGWGPAALAGGIGIDARGYLAGLLSLGR